MWYHVLFHKEEKNPCMMPANKNNSIWGLNFWLSPFPSTLVFGVFFFFNWKGWRSIRPEAYCRSHTGLPPLFVWEVGILHKLERAPNPAVALAAARLQEFGVTSCNTRNHGLRRERQGPPNNMEFGIHSSKHRALNLWGRVHGWRLRSQLTFAIFRQNSLSSSQWKYSMSPFCGALVGRTGSPLSITSPTYPLTPHLPVPACPYSTQLFS